MKIDKLIIGCTLIITALALSSCAKTKSTQQTIGTPNMEATYNIVRTQAAATVIAQQKATALINSIQTATAAALTKQPLPTNTQSSSAISTAVSIPSVTRTPLPTSTVFPTSTPITPTSPPAYCLVTAQNPKPGQTLNPGDDFDARWTIKNISKDTWDVSNTDYGYLSGQKMYKHNAIYDFPKNVAPNESIELIVDMLAPMSSGSYNTNWAIIFKGKPICTLSLSINVK